MRLAIAVTLVLGVASANSLADVSRQLANATCTLAQDVDYPGNDIGNVLAASSDCCTKCAATSGCYAFTWTNYNGGTCWLKSGEGSPVTKAGAKSAVLTRVTTAPTTAPTTTPPTTCSIQTNVDFVGNDVANAPGTVATDCCAKCHAMAGCGAFSWTDYNGGTCWLKSSKGAITKASAGVHSAVISASYSCPTLQQHVDYIGNDIGSVAGTGAADCCSKCAARGGCNAFTWSNFNSGTCWLKSGKGTTATVFGVVSAVLSKGVMDVVTPTPTTPTPTTTKPPTHIMPRLRAGEIPLRAVNLGGWLVGEYWMSMLSPAWTGAGEAVWGGEYTTMMALGKEVGTKQFEAHRASWIVESDIQEIKAAGLNAVRVPVVFWIVNDIDPPYATNISSVYAPGALKYLDKLINEWAVKHNIAVMLSLHSHQGSQNGYDHSAPQSPGQINWSSSQANVDNSLQLATVLAARYKDSASFLGLNLMNEPNYPINSEAVYAYYKEAYKRIRATGNNCVVGVSPMLVEQALPSLMYFMRHPEFFNVWHEFHVYYRWGYEKTRRARRRSWRRPSRTAPRTWTSGRATGS